MYKISGQNSVLFSSNGFCRNELFIITESFFSVRMSFMLYLFLEESLRSATRKRKAVSEDEEVESTDEESFMEEEVCF